MHTMYYLDKQKEEEDVKEGEDVEHDDDDCHLALDVVELAVLLLDLGAHAHRHVGEVAQDAEDYGDDLGLFEDKEQTDHDDVAKLLLRLWWQN